MYTSSRIYPIPIEKLFKPLFILFTNIPPNWLPNQPKGAYFFLHNNTNCNHL